MLLDAPFTAVTQIIIYAGAIMVLFLFVVMLLNAPAEDEARARDVRSRHGDRRGAVGGAGRRGGLGVVPSRRRAASAWRRRAASISSVARSAMRLFTTHAFAFEVTSILILVSMVGAVVIARKEH